MRRRLQRIALWHGLRVIGRAAQHHAVEARAQAAVEQLGRDSA